MPKMWWSRESQFYPRNAEVSKGFHLIQHNNRMRKEGHLVPVCCAQRLLRECGWSNNYIERVTCFGWDYFMLKYAASKEQNISHSKIVKILSTVPHDKGFHFFTDQGSGTGETATSLETFAQKLEAISADSVKFHFQRKDFQNWIQTTVGDGVLAERINHISGQLPVEELRNELVKTVEKRLSQLKLLHGESIASQ